MTPLNLLKWFTFSDSARSSQTFKRCKYILNIFSSISSVMWGSNDCPNLLTFVDVVEHNMHCSITTHIAYCTPLYLLHLNGKTSTILSKRRCVSNSPYNLMSKRAYGMWELTIWGPALGVEAASLCHSWMWRASTPEQQQMTSILLPQKC